MVLLRSFVTFAVCIASAALAPVGCGRQNPCARHTPNANPFVTQVSEGLMAEILGEEERPFPHGFHFGAATAAYQIESGNAASDWYLWEQLPGRIRDGDRADHGPASEQHIGEDLDALQAMGLDSYRFSIEWGRLFPTREQFDAESPDPMALAYYRGLLEALHARGIRPMVTLHHFTLPIWLQAPPAPEPTGVLEDDFIPLLTRFSGWAAAELGDLVDYWITVNEPNGVAAGGYGGGVFPPGRIADFESFERVYLRLIEAHARMYDEIRDKDRRDADGDGLPALISFATHNRLWLPMNPDDEADVRAARRVRYISNLMPLDAVVCGNLDKNFDEKWSKNGDRVADPSLANRLDFIALNFYGSAYVAAFDVEPFLGFPVLANPASPWPKNDMGWDMTPETLLPVLDELTVYGLPIIITENGVADASDNRRPKFVVDSLAAASSAVARGHDLRGYYHWSLIDNFEWAEGYCPRFGLYGIDFTAPSRTRLERESARVMRQITAARAVPAGLRSLYTYGPPSPCL